MHKYAQILMVTVLSSIFGAGCANVNYPVQTKPENVVTVPRGDVHRYDDLDYRGLELNTIVSRMADQLERYKVSHIEDLSKLAIITFVDVSSYKRPNELGRVIAEDFIHEMHRRGENVYEHHLIGYVEVTPEGDIMLSRNARELARKMAVSRFLIGTLSRNREGYVVNARIVSLKNNLVESTAVGIVPYSLVPSHSAGVSNQKRTAVVNRNQSRMSGGMIVREDPSARMIRQSSVK
jgi:TolB-like protein